jgi:glycine/D-amino acid oxidase-like deaminating enzyme
MDLAKLGRQLWEELAGALPDDFEFEPKGGIVVAETDRQLASLEGTIEGLRAAQVAVERLSPADLAREEPFLARDLPGGLYFPQDAQVQPMLACAALVKAAKSFGAVFLPQTELLKVELDGRGAVRAALTSAGRIGTPRLINAAGPWSTELAGLVGLDLPARPRKGHIIVTEPLPLLVRHKVFEAGYADTVNSGESDLQVASVVEATRSGTILLGSSRQLVGFDPAVDTQVLRAIARRAVRFFPVLAQVQALRAYAGFRSFTPDHLPIIGESKQVPGFFLNTGHEGAGIALGPVSARLLSQLILDQAPVMDPFPFRPERFSAIGEN